MVFQDTYHHSDHDIIVLAKDPKHAEEKCKQHLSHKGIKHETLQILTDAEFQKIFGKTNPYYIFFQNGVGKKFCRIFAKNKKNAADRFNKRIQGHAELINIMNQKEFNNRHNEDKKTKEISLPPIICKPLFSRAVNE